MKTRPRRLTEEQPSQIFLTEARTFMPRVAPNPEEGRLVAALAWICICCCWKRAITAMAPGRGMAAVKRGSAERVNARRDDIF